MAQNLKPLCRTQDFSRQRNAHWPDCSFERPRALSSKDVRVRAREERNAARATKLRAFFS